MFNFTVKYLGFLKRIPLLPHIFDTFLKLSYLIFNRKIVEFIDEIESTVSKWDNITVSMHKYGGTQFNCGKREVGHIHSNGLVDILFDRKKKEELLGIGLAEDHHIFKNSGWVSLYIRTEADKDNAILLLQMSLLKQRASK